MAHFSLCQNFFEGTVGGADCGSGEIDPDAVATQLARLCNVGKEAMLEKLGVGGGDAGIFEGATAPAAAIPADDTGATSGSEGTAAPTAVAAEATPSASGTFTLEQLQSSVPTGVDASKKETYLSDADFQTHFGMDKAAFAKLPAWKSKGVKQELGLF